MKQTVIAILFLACLLLFSLSCEKKTCDLSESMLQIVDDTEKAIALKDPALAAHYAEKAWGAWIKAENGCKLYLSHSHIERIRDHLINVSAAANEEDLKKMSFYLNALRHELLELQEMESLQLESLL